MFVGDFTSWAGVFRLPGGVCCVFACMSFDRRIPALANDRFDLASFTANLTVLNRDLLLSTTSRL